MKQWRLVVVLLAALLLLGQPRVGAEPPAAGQVVYLPLVGGQGSTAPSAPSCEVAGATYQRVPTVGTPSTRPDVEHADLNLALRGYEPTSAPLGLVEYGGAWDPAAPQLAGLFSDARALTFTSVARVHDWDWGCNCQGSLIPYSGYPNLPFPVTLLGMGTSPNEVIHLPERQGGEIYPGGFKALVIFASDTRMTVKYTREGDVIQGYTLHLENLCVEPTLLELYRTTNAAGRRELPALRPGQPLGRARGSELGVAVRDNGTFMDPRSRRDWWHGR